MFIVNLKYTKPLDEVDNYLEGHIAWLLQHFEQEDFIAAGRKVPRTGGVILVKSMAKEQIEDILKQDPFQAIADYELIEVEFSRALHGFDNLISA
ncbi:YciI family protein [Acinetobacter nectaris]|uniref:YciI family protein n=1 Tax=Acinetobacter nectaris TaxID=1219382 RepID=UPI001F165BC6|nr:hypothetical protein [Acinetobacter nectaris]